MVPLLAALLAAAQPAPAPQPATLGHTARIFSTVGHSEFCPAGNVMVDLRTGRFAFTPRATRRVCNQVGLERPVRKGILSSQNLASLRTAYLRVLSEGLERPVCREGGRPQDVIVNNGGTPILVLTSGKATGAAPDDLSCWSEAATTLHDTLDRVFDPPHYR